MAFRTSHRVVVAACAALTASLAAIVPAGAFVGNLPPAPGIYGGSVVTKLTPNIGDWAYSLASLNGSLYFTTTLSHTCTLWRSNTAGLNRSPVTTLANCYQMSVAVGPDGRLWYGSEVVGSPIYSIKTDGTNRVQMAIAPHGASRLAFDGLGHLYAQSETTGYVTEMNLDGTHANVSSTNNNSYGFALDHSGHYYLDDKSEGVRANVDGTNQTSFAIGDYVENVLPLADGNVLWGDFQNNAMYITDAAGQNAFQFAATTSTPEQTVLGATPGVYYFMSWDDGALEKLQQSPFAVAANNSASISWTASPSADSPILSYTVTAHSLVGGPLLQQTVPGNHLSTTFFGLTNAVRYQFTVHATNAFGDSIESSLTNPVVPGAQYPSAPHVPTVSAQSGAVHVSLGGANSNGSALTGYVVTAFSGPGPYKVAAQQAFPGSATSATLTGLSNATSYRVTVTAINAIGVSDSSPMSVSFTPTGPPTWRFAPTAVAGSKSAKVSWFVANPNGLAIKGYTVVSSPGAKSCSTTTALSCTVKGLTGGKSYTFKVTATNAKGPGTSAASNSVTAKH